MNTNEEPVSRASLLQDIDFHRGEIASIERRLASLKCRDCDHWTDSEPRCLRWNETPPAEVQSVGCDEWREIDIPF